MRRTQLLDDYGFVCDCARCVAEGGPKFCEPPASPDPMVDGHRTAARASEVEEEEEKEVERAAAAANARDITPCAVPPVELRSRRREATLRLCAEKGQWAAVDLPSMLSSWDREESAL